MLAMNKQKTNTLYKVTNNNIMSNTVNHTVEQPAGCYHYIYELFGYKDSMDIIEHMKHGNIACYMYLDDRIEVVIKYNHAGGLLPATLF